MKKKVVVAMSGGVDSSVTVALLKEQGYDVSGVTMSLWDGKHSNAADEPFPDVVAGARIVAEQLDIPFHGIDLKDEFRKTIVDPFCDAYLSARTPNPCIVCNKYMKFGKLLDFARELGADYLATGHYVRLAEHDGFVQIRKGRDVRKDQSYFLFALNQDQLKHCLFPLGDMTKDEVRDYAARIGLSVAEKSESQDICFIPDGDYARFLDLERVTSNFGGEIVHVSGQVLGRDRGMHLYTVGQRKGLGIGWTEPLYVVRLDAEKRQVVVGEKSFLSGTELTIAGCCWNTPLPAGKLRSLCRIRYRHKETPVAIEILDRERAKVVFDEPQFGITPGQAAVFYDEDRVVGGGWIQ
jgi:tRNA-specific 2-thiouridylase